MRVLGFVRQANRVPLVCFYRQSQAQNSSSFHQWHPEGKKLKVRRRFPVNSTDKSSHRSCDSQPQREEEEEMSTSPGVSEFVSDAFDSTAIDQEDLKKEMEQLVLDKKESLPSPDGNHHKTFTVLSHKSRTRHLSGNQPENSIHSQIKPSPKSLPWLWFTGVWNQNTFIYPHGKFCW